MLSYLRSIFCFVAEQKTIQLSGTMSVVSRGTIERYFDGNVLKPSHFRKFCSCHTFELNHFPAGLSVRLDYPSGPILSAF